MFCGHFYLNLDKLFLKKSITLTTSNDDPKVGRTKSLVWQHARNGLHTTTCSNLFLAML